MHGKQALYPKLCPQPYLCSSLGYNLFACVVCVAPGFELTQTGSSPAHELVFFVLASVLWHVSNSTHILLAH